MGIEIFPCSEIMDIVLGSGRTFLCLFASHPALDLHKNQDILFTEEKLGLRVAG